MKVSLAWLQEWAGRPLDAAALDHDLSMAGLEVDSCQPLSEQPPNGVVSAYITEVKAHPHADRLRVCRVDDGGGKLRQVVCGACKVHVGLCLPYARPGANLSGRTLETAKILGLESEGILCSAAQLGLDGEDQGLPVLPQSLGAGADVADYLALNDTIMEVDLTPNRGDCLSLLGLTREICALHDLPFSPVFPSDPSARYSQKPGVRLQADSACPRYLARLVRGLHPGLETPLWMQERLRRCGVACVHPVVDVMNYVMLEWGQPMHAFDYATVHGDLHVRYAAAAESLTLLNGEEVKLNQDDLLIADDRRALALAGVMGGADSMVTPDTREALIECAYFTPEAVAGRARRYGLHTDASHRFERGVDPGLQATAMARAGELLVELYGLELGETLECTADHHSIERPAIKLRYEAIPRCLGIQIDKAEVPVMLRRLQCKVKPVADGCTCEPPSCRFDLNEEIDLLEEIARLYGYDKIPGKSLGVPQLGRRQDKQTRLAQYGDYLSHQGYSQIISYSFVEPELNAMLSEKKPPPLDNPISPAASVMRSSLLPGLLQTLLYNFNHYQTRIRLFESGSVFFMDQHEQVQEHNALAAVAFGPRYPQQWRKQNSEADFFFIKNELEQLLKPWRRHIQWRASDHRAYQKGQSAEVYYADRCIARAGRLNPLLEEERKLPKGVCMFELLSPLFELEPEPTIFQPLSAYPPVRRDIAVMVDKDVSAEQLLACVRAAAGERMTRVVVFDVFLSDKLEQGKKSVALGLIFQDFCRTLESREIDQWVADVLSALAKEFNAQLRSL